MDDRKRAYEAFLATFNGGATAAALDFAHRAQVAVAWVDRDVIERHIERKLTDAEWRLLVPQLDDYDEHISNTEGAEDGFIDSILKETGIEQS